MLAPPAIAVPIDSPRSVSPSAASFQQDLPAPPRFPHTRAQLSAIARQYRSLDSYDDDPEGDDLPRVNSGLVARVASLLDQEREDDLKNLLRDTFGHFIDNDELSQHVLDLMHRHRDDLDGVPFVFLAPTRRPISRPSSRASSHSARLMPNRPDTPTSAPSSPLAMIFRRPHTPLTSPLGVQQSSSYMSARSGSPSASPIISYAQFASSLPASPSLSPRILNAKASEFRPLPRPLSAASSNPASLSALRADTPSPDLWAHNPQRPTSKLAIAAPLTPDSTLLPRSTTPSSLRSSLRPGMDDDDDPFDPFAPNNIPLSFHPVASPDISTEWMNSSQSDSDNSRSHFSNNGEFAKSYSSQSMQSRSSEADMDPDAAAVLTDGMTPFDVLSSVFGATLAPSELEEALANNGYDFERSMTWLVDRALGPGGQHIIPTRVQPMGNRVVVVSREGQGGMVRGRAGYNNINAPAGRGAPRPINGRPVQGGNRVCRYFLAGECLRADCRFSHDLERALCRFWLRGTCAKGDTCEFLHHLPNEIDVSGLSAAMSRAEISNGGPETVRTAPIDEFPALNHTVASGGKNRRGHSIHGRDETVHYDPGRTRFAAAVKKPAAAVPPVTSMTTASRDPALVAARREAMGTSGEPLNPSTAIVAPRPSARLRLRPPSLLPTLPTGESVNSLYVAYRGRALQLGAARNACLSRAADAWRRGDGAAAKRFSREGHDLNSKMSAEMVEAAGKLVRERATLAEQAVRCRDASWSDDPGDRTARGRICGAGLGVCLGIAGQSVGDGKKTTPEERTECLLDLHGLHATEATEVMEEFLLALEREHFYGLAYLVVGEEKHTGTQDPARGASRARLATGVREWLHLWGYPWSERDGVICVDPLTHA